MKQIRVKIEGMTCNGCVNGIKKAFANDKDVVRYDISLDKEEGLFETSLAVDEVIKRIEDQGFDATEIS